LARINEFLGLRLGGKGDECIADYTTLEEFGHCVPPMEGQVVHPMRFFICRVCAVAGQRASPNLTTIELTIV